MTPLVFVRVRVSYLVIKLSFYYAKHYDDCRHPTTESGLTWTSNLRFRRGSLFNTLVLDEFLNSGQRNFASRNYKHCFIVRCKMHFDILSR